MTNQPLEIRPINMGLVAPLGANRYASGRLDIRRMKTIRTLAILALTLAAACSKEDTSGWYLDPSFSLQLVTFNEKIPAFGMQDPADAVEVLQIFRSERDQDTLNTVTEIRSKLLVYETRRSEEIQSLFRATRIETKERCNSPQGDYVFSILAFDRDLMRVGYIKYFPCERDDVGWFTTYGSNSIYDSSETAKVINKMIPASIQRKATK
jgi:hypothetical protein